MGSIWTRILRCFGARDVHDWDDDDEFYSRTDFLRRGRCYTGGNASCAVVGAR